MFSALGGTRTPNLLIRSQMLYPLSYERWERGILTEAVRTLRLPAFDGGADGFLVLIGLGARGAGGPDDEAALGHEDAPGRGDEVPAVGGLEGGHDAGGHLVQGPRR